MKRLLYLFVCALPFFFVASCDDEKDYPNVDFSIDIAGGQFVNGQIYVATDTTLAVTSVNVINNEQGKKAIITLADYYWNSFFLGESVVAPYGINIDIPANMPTGKYFLQIITPVYAVDKTPAYASTVYTVNVVESIDDIPTGGTTTYRHTPSVQESQPSVK